MTRAGSADRYVFPPPAAVGVPVCSESRLFPVHRVYGVGQNYARHAREMGAAEREAPFFFSKPADAVTTLGTLPFPGMTENLHHEVELVVALGSGGRSIAVEAALGCVFGYAVGVDLTRRDLQSEAKKKGRPWTTAKGFDRSAPVSAVRPAGDAGRPDHADIALSVNGQERQRGNTSEMIWSVAEIIARLSTYFELAAGDLVFTGTPAGVGPLRPGDRVDCSIEGVGSLRFELSS
jgi:fumarylpyruvate hydrolase